MPAVAELEKLKEAQKDLTATKKKHPQAYDAVVEVIKNHKMIGYGNICKMMQGVTPETLKGLKK